MKTINTLICGVAALIVSATALAIPSTISKFVPQTMNYQGYLANPSTGAAYTDGIYDIECRLYRVATGGSAIWGAKYSVYVKDGYFNIMLGDVSGSSIYSTVSGTGTPTYGYTADGLMKALWFYSTSYPDLWLGVTPHQGPTHATLSSKSEILPRQQLLTAPYAFRAQSAEYANQSEGNFTVNGSLTVTGSLSFPNSYSFQFVKADKTKNTLILGYSGGGAYSDNPAITNAASYYVVKSYYGQKYMANNGDLYFESNSSRGFQFNLGNFAVTNNNSISLHNGSYCDLDMRSGYTTLSGNYSELNANNAATVSSKNSSVYLEAPQGSVYIHPSTNSYVYGQGTVYWKKPGATGYNKPMFVRKFTVPVAANASNGSLNIDDYLAKDWVATVAGFESKNLSDLPPNCVRTKLNTTTGKYWIQIYLNSTKSTATEYYVDVLFIQKTFGSDNR